MQKITFIMQHWSSAKINIRGASTDGIDTSPTSTTKATESRTKRKFNKMDRKLTAIQPTRIKDPSVYNRSNQAQKKIKKKTLIPLMIRASYCCSIHYTDIISTSSERAQRERERERTWKPRDWQDSTTMEDWWRKSYDSVGYIAKLTWAGPAVK